jgi:hypothetical protein
VQNGGNVGGQRGDYGRGGRTHRIPAMVQVGQRLVEQLLGLFHLGAAGGDKRAQRVENGGEIFKRFYFFLIFFKMFYFLFL